MFHIKYRPNSLEGIFGHQEIVKGLKNIFNAKETPHAFLFSGVSGTGKTTFARILANMLKADKNEIIETNIANETGIDFIREISESAKYSPLLGASKVFILDEIQMLSKEGMNCLLKVMEDTPKHSYFILCTTDPQKLLLPLRNRCLQYTLKSLQDNEIASLLDKVIKEEGIETIEDIKNLIIFKAEGIPRSALVYLNQIQGITNFEEASTILSDNITEEGEIIELCRMMIKRPRINWKDLVKIFENINIDPESMRIVIAGYLAACLKKADSPGIYAEKLELFLSPLTFGSQKSEILLLLYKAWCL